MELFYDFGARTAALPPQALSGWGSVMGRRTRGLTGPGASAGGPGALSLGGFSRLTMLFSACVFE